MRIQIPHDVAVSKNLRAGNADVTCAYPMSVVLANGDMACVYRRGKEKHSYDGILLLQTSSNQGLTWSEPVPVFNGLNLDPPQSATAGHIGLTPRGALMTAFRVTEVTRPDVYVFSKEGLTQKRHVYVMRSEDSDKTWSGPVEIDASMFPQARVTAKPLALPDGDLCVPLEVTATYGPNGTAATFSADDGRTFERPVTFAADVHGKLNWCDARFTLLKDGRILMLLWTFLQDTEFIIIKK